MFLQVEDAADVGMVDRARKLDFLFETFDGEIVAGEDPVNCLECDWNLQFGIEGAVDFAHAAFGNEGFDAEASCEGVAG